jgi:hypothetical protein
MNHLNKNLGNVITNLQLSNLSKKAFSELSNKAFITFFHDDGFEAKWFPVLLNGKHIKFDDDLTMEICREKFGHTAFGISNGVQASRRNAQRDNL